MYDFDLPVSRRGTSCLKWDSLDKVFGRADILPFWVADMDFASPPGVTAALKAKAEHPVYGYHSRTKALFQSVSEWIAKRHYWNIEPDWLLNAPGVVPSISIAILALTEPGDQIIIQPPVYPPFFSCITENKRELVENPLISHKGRYVPDFDDLERKMNPKVKLLLLCSPHNPAGRVWTQAELSHLADICLRHKVIIVSDEIHCDLVFDGNKHIPTSLLAPEVAQSTVTFISPSKTFNIAGTYTSFAVIANKALRSKFGQWLQTLHLESGNLFGIAAAEAAYRTGEQWLVELLPYLESNANFLVDYFKTNIPEVKTYLPQGTYLAWLDFNEAGIAASELQSFLVYEAGLGLNDGLSFGAQGRGFARFNFACPRAMLTEGLVRLGTALRKH